MKLLSLNVSIFDENNKKLTSFLQEINPDIICLQEVTRKVDNFAFDSFITKDAVDQATPNLPYSFYAPNWCIKNFKQNNFHGKEIFQHDFGGFIECGNYIKSKFEITKGESIFIQNHFSYLTNWESMASYLGEEPRMVQIADIKLRDSKKLRILNYHGIWSRDKRGSEKTKSASQKLVQLADKASYPSIICGDFNLFPHTKSMKIFKEKYLSLVDEFKITHTRPKSNELSQVKRNVVDYIFISKELEVKKFKVIDSDVSDHFPLLLDFDFEY